MSDTVIKVEGVSKKYCRSLKHTMLYGVADLSRSFLGLNQQTERLRDGEFWAVNDVSLEVKRGKINGIIGANGSGKSTLLKMLNGIMMPDKGRIEISGRVGALIEVGAGFHPMLTGRENIYINGAIIGMTKKEIDKKFDEIVDFAGIDNFIDSPVKHYSSGMYVRLGFAIAAHAEPDILLVDEALAVGDVRFQHKCMEMIRRYEGTRTIFFVSHDISAIVNICDSTIWLDGGRIVEIGEPKEVTEHYLASIYESIHKDKGVHMHDNSFNSKETEDPSRLLKIDEIFESFGVKGAKLTGILFEISGKGAATCVSGGDNVSITLEATAYMDIENPIFGISVRDRMGNNVFGINNNMVGECLHKMEGGRAYKIVFKFTWPHLIPGSYSISPAIADGYQKDHIMHHWVYDALIVQTQKRIEISGWLGIPDAKVFFEIGNT